MRDREAVVWTRVGVQPLKMGSLHVTERESRFTYADEFLRTDLPGLGIVYAPGIYGRNTIKRPRSERFDFHPPLQALVPPRGERNFQRQLILRYLDGLGIERPSDFDTDWEILVRAGHGGIGHLDVFASDAEAVGWYSTPSRKGWFEAGKDFGFSLKEFLTWLDHGALPLIEIIGPTPSVGGAIPKLLLSIPRTGWDGRIGLPTRYGDTDRADIVLKLEQPQAYPGIIELEALALDLHQEAGFDTPRHWKVEINGVRGLAIERFDRSPQCVPLFTESLYSLLASGSRRITHHYSASYDTIGRAIDNVELSIVSDRMQAKKHLLKRLVLAMLTGNGDLHLENLSLLLRDGALGFSPVYDPTPMRAYSIHDMLTAMPFGDYGDIPDGQDEPIGLKQAWERFAKGLGIKRNDWLAVVDGALKATADYPDRVSRLATLPDANKDHLSALHKSVRERFESL